MARYDADDRVAFIPGFAVGGVVRETGIALVHEGEWIVPAPGSAASIEPAGPGAGGPTLEVRFPVEVVVAGALSEADREAIEQRIFNSLADALERLG